MTAMDGEIPANAGNAAPDGTVQLPIRPSQPSGDGLVAGQTLTGKQEHCKLTS